MPNGSDYKAKVRPHGPIEDNPEPNQPEIASSDASEAGDGGFESAAQDIINDPNVAPVEDGEHSGDSTGEQSIGTAPKRAGTEHQNIENAKTMGVGPESSRSIGRKG